MIFFNQHVFKNSLNMFGTPWIELNILYRVYIYLHAFIKVKKVI